MLHGLSIRSIDECFEKPYPCPFAVLSFQCSVAARQWGSWAVCVRISCSLTVKAVTCEEPEPDLPHGLFLFARSRLPQTVRMQCTCSVSISKPFPFDVGYQPGLDKEHVFLFRHRLGSLGPTGDDDVKKNILTHLQCQPRRD